MMSLPMSGEIIFIAQQSLSVNPRRGKHEGSKVLSTVMAALGHVHGAANVLCGNLILTPLGVQYGSWIRPMIDGDSEFSKAAVAASDLCKFSWWHEYTRLRPVEIGVVLELERELLLLLVEVELLVMGKLE